MAFVSVQSLLEDKIAFEVAHKMYFREYFFSKIASTLKVLLFGLTALSESFTSFAPLVLEMGYCTLQ